MTTSPIAVTWETEVVNVDAFTATHHMAYIHDLLLPIGAGNNVFAGRVIPNYYRNRLEVNDWFPIAMIPDGVGVQVYWLPYRVSLLAEETPVKRILIPIPGRSDFIANYNPFRSSEDDLLDWFLCTDGAGLPYYQQNNSRGGSNQQSTFLADVQTTAANAYPAPGNSKWIFGNVDNRFYPQNLGKLMNPPAPTSFEQNVLSGHYYSGNGDIVFWAFRQISDVFPTPTGVDFEVDFIGGSSTQVASSGVEFDYETSPGSGVRVYYGSATITPDINAGDVISYIARAKWNDQASFGAGRIAMVFADQSVVAPQAPPYQVASIDGQCMQGYVFTG